MVFATQVKTLPTVRPIVLSTATAMGSAIRGKMRNTAGKIVTMKTRSLVLMMAIVVSAANIVTRKAILFGIIPGAGPQEHQAPIVSGAIPGAHVAQAKRVLNPAIPRHASTHRRARQAARLF